MDSCPSGRRWSKSLSLCHPCETHIEFLLPGFGLSQPQPRLFGEGQQMKDLSLNISHTHTHMLYLSNKYNKYFFKTSGISDIYIRVWYLQMALGISMHGSQNFFTPK